MKYLFLLLMLGCNQRSGWIKCSQELHLDPKPSQLYSRTINSVLMSDGEICVVEEVAQYSPWTDCNSASTNIGYDELHGCQYCLGYSSPLVRRLNCVSGKNGKSIVKDDGTKFHRELLE